MRLQAVLLQLPQEEGGALSEEAEMVLMRPFVPFSDDDRSQLLSAFMAARMDGSSRSADLSLRIGSKHRFKNEESFTDTVYQNHVSNNGHKAVGVELLVPFQ